MTYIPGLDIGPAPDTTPGAPGPGVDAPDPFAPADQTDYRPASPAGVDATLEYLPPWGFTRAPGTVRTIAPGEIIPLDPWLPVLAMLNGEQMAMLNRLSASRQAAAYTVDSPRKM